MSRTELAVAIIPADDDFNDDFTNGGMAGVLPEFKEAFLCFGEHYISWELSLVEVFN